MANAKSFCTIPFNVGPITEAQNEKLKAMTPKERAAHKAEVVKQHKTAVPLGPYPWHTKGSGWVQLWFTDDAELKYVFYDWAKGLSIRVIPVNKESGTVTVKCRSEVFDDASGHLTLQQDPWSQRITVSRAKEIILNEQAN